MTYLLDTNVWVAILRNSSPHVSARFRVVAPSGDLRACSVVVAELLFGALRSHQAVKNLADVRAFTSGFPSLPFDDRAADEYAKVRADLTARGTLIGPNDLMIAAIALANGLILVTHNTTEFSRVAGLTLDDWQI